MRFLDRFFDRLRTNDLPPFALQRLRTEEDIPDEEIERAIRSVPCHYGAAIFDQSQLLGMVNHASANAGNYTGTGAVVIATGSAAPGSHVDFLRVAAKASVTSPTNARIYVKNGGTYYRQFTVSIPQWTIVTGEREAYWTVMDVKPSIPLPSASYTLETNQETADSLDFSAYGGNYV